MPKHELLELKNNVYNNALKSERVYDSGSDQDINLDYDMRTDDNPVYVGFGAKGLADGADGWLIFKLTYDASDRVTAKKSAYGVWNDRASLFT